MFFVQIQQNQLLIENIVRSECLGAFREVLRSAKNEHNAKPFIHAVWKVRSDFRSANEKNLIKSTKTTPAPNAPNQERLTLGAIKLLKLLKKVTLLKVPLLKSAPRPKLLIFNLILRS